MQRIEALMIGPRLHPICFNGVFAPMVKLLHRLPRPRHYGNLYVDFCYN